LGRQAIAKLQTRYRFPHPWLFGA